MSAVFTRASSMRLVNSAPLLPSTGYPFSVGMWLNMTSVSATFNILFSYADTGVDNHALRVQIDSAERLAINATAGGTSANGTLTSALVAGQWAYCVARFISSTNRRISARYRSGLIEHAQSTTSRAPTSLDTMALGISQDLTPDSPCDASIAEFWYTNTDIQADGAQLQNSTLHQLAFDGPFALPHIAKDIIEYRSFRKHPTAGDGWDIYFGRSASNWTNTNGVVTGPHPPLPGTYARPPWARRRGILVPV